MFNIKFTDNSDTVMRAVQGASKSAARVMQGKIVNYARAAVMKARGPMGNGWRLDDLITLRDSITGEVSEGPKGPVITVGSNLQIAPYIELGTARLYEPPPEWERYHNNFGDRHSKAGLSEWWYFDEAEGVFKIGKPVPSQPYLRPAILDHAEEYKQILNEKLKAEDKSGFRGLSGAIEELT